MEERRSESSGSEARRVFDAHSDNVMYLLRLILRDIGQLDDRVDAAEEITERAAAAVRTLRRNVPGGQESNNALSLAGVSTDLDALHKHYDEIGTSIRAHPFLYDWMLAMMVSFAEAYLEHVLLLLTTTHPAWMATKDRAVSGYDVLKIDAELPTERRWQGLMEIMRQRWTKEFLRERPGTWISRLEKLGAPKYREGLEAEMTSIWNRRHAVVHTPPGPGSDHVTGLSGSVVTRFVQSKNDLIKAIEVIHSFVDATDAFAEGCLIVQP
jgi:hypothetical protein